MPHMTDTGLDRLEKIARLLVEIRSELNVRTTLGELMVFILVATDAGLTATEMHQSTGIAKSTLGNALSNLSKGREDGRGRGFDLIESYTDVNDRRNTRWKLTGKGVRFAKRLSEKA